MQRLVSTLKWKTRIHSHPDQNWNFSSTKGLRSRNPCFGSELPKNRSYYVPHKKFQFGWVGWVGILGNLRLKSSLRSFIFGGRGYSWLAKNRVFCVILTTFLSHNAPRTQLWHFKQKQSRIKQKGGKFIRLSKLTKKLCWMHRNCNHNRNKKTFRKDAYRPLANFTCFGGQHQMSVLVGGWGGFFQVNKFEQVSSNGHQMSLVARSHF